MPDLGQVFAALSDDTRRAIIERLARGPASVGELANPFPMSAAAVSQHLRVLEQAGLVRRRVSAQRRIISLNDEALAPAREWLERQREFWAGQVDSLHEHLVKQRKLKRSYVGRRD